MEQKKIKILRLKPSLKENRRYFIINSDSKKEIEDAILSYLGILGFSKSGFMFAKVDKMKDKIIGSCLREHLTNVKSSLILKNIQIENVSSTIKGLTR